MPLDQPLTEIQTRILGCLVEKQATTPDQYPLTLNALRTACNQKTNRFPVTAYYEGEIGHALMELGELRLVSKHSAARSAKYAHHLQEQLEVLDKETAVLCVLMLRGPQTASEIRTRCQRIYAFEDVDDVQYVLDRLCQREPPYVTILPRQPGQKEQRYMHLLAGEPDPELMAAAAAPSTSVTLSERVSQLEAQVAELQERLVALEKDNSQA